MLTAFVIIFPWFIFSCLAFSVAVEVDDEKLGVPAAGSMFLSFIALVALGLIALIIQINK